MFDSLDSIGRRLAHPDWRMASALLELVLIGSVVYVVLRFLRGTRGERLLRGMGLVLLAATLVVSLLADALNLERIRVLYPPFLVGVLLAAVVAFQPELRRALIRLGATRWFGGLTGEFDKVTEAVVESTEYLSRRKVGALIAIERTTQLGALIERGARLDAEVTAPLLNTIFWPGSMLHDMGVVISQGRLAAASVPFPLTDDDEVDPSLGSRHRAALGLSEDSDALVVVVSEETGAISLVERGRMHRFLSPESLREELQRSLAEAPAESAPAELIPEPPRPADS